MASALRRAVDVVGVLAGAGALVIVAFVGLNHYRTKEKMDVVVAGLREFDRMIAVQAMSSQVEFTRRGWPATIDPSWFMGSPPRNPFMPPDAPWLEVAPEIESNLLDPPARVAPNRLHAGFWYNPYQGVVRARVPLIVSESRSVELYNRLNGRHISAGYEPNPRALKIAATPPLTAVEPSQESDKSIADVPVEGRGGH